MTGIVGTGINLPLNGLIEHPFKTPTVSVSNEVCEWLISALWSNWSCASIKALCYNATVESLSINSLIELVLVNDMWYKLEIDWLAGLIATVLLWLLSIVSNTKFFKTVLVYFLSHHHRLPVLALLQPKSWLFFSERLTAASM